MKTIEREAAVDIARRTGDTDQPIGPHTCLTPEQESIWRDACGVVERGIRALDPSTRYAELEKAARELLELDRDQHEVIVSAARFDDLQAALAALEGGGQRE